MLFRSEVKNDVAAGSLSMGHARAILGVADEAAQRRIAREAVSRGLSVRETEALVRKESEPKHEVESPKVDPNTKAAEDRLRHALGTRVRIIRKGKGGRHIATDTDFVTALLEEKHVATVQGAAYGMSPYFRISYATDLDSIREGCKRIKEFCADLR